MNNRFNRGLDRGTSREEDVNAMMRAGWALLLLHRLN